MAKTAIQQIQDQDSARIIAIRKKAREEIRTIIDSHFPVAFVLWQKLHPKHTDKAQLNLKTNRFEVYWENEWNELWMVYTDIQFGGDIKEEARFEKLFSELIDAEVWSMEIVSQNTIRNEQ